VVVIDWPHAWTGAPFCDMLTLLSSARLSGIDPQPIAETHPLTRDLMPGQIDGFLALHSGFLLRAVASAGPGADPPRPETTCRLNAVKDGAARSPKRSCRAGAPSAMTP
jgi:hypothetical protein